MKRCFIVVDYQIDFVAGHMGFEGAKLLEKPIAAKIREYRADGGDIIFTLDNHAENYLEACRKRSRPAPSEVDGNENWLLYGEVGGLREEGDLCFRKSTYGSDMLYSHLKRTRYSSIELAGVSSDICVLANAVLARTARPDAEILIDASCTASADEALNKAALNIFEGLKIKVIGKKGRCP